ncbi:MAG TPA: hypothetical protein VFY39_05170 [Gammaproteobacteria bacterium]|nr:hypothetical protein [Gammaproteobacteria bacterium]
MTAISAVSVLAAAVAAFVMPAPVRAQLHAAKAPTLLDPEIVTEIVQRGARIGRIEIDIDNVFDPTKPAENKKLYRFANRIHVKTHPNVVRDILLFHPGDTFDPRLLEESARLLRSRTGIADATIVPSAYDADSNTVDVLVNTRDAWSLSLDMKFGRSGGENDFGIGIEEGNLFGTGKKLLLSHSSDVDRAQNIIGYTDENVLGSRVRLNTAYADTSDGLRKELDVGRPFFALNTRWSLMANLLDERRIDKMYDLGETVDEFEHFDRTASIEGGWSRGLVEGRTRRWLFGMTYAEDRFDQTDDRPDPLVLPEDRKLVYPWVGFQVVADDFRELEELNEIGRTEDVHLGLSFRGSIGYSSEGLGADRNSWLLRLDAHKGWEPAGGQLLLVDADASTRREHGRLRNTLVTAAARYYRRNLGNKLFLVSADATTTSRLDREQQVLVGGDSGLRGYPLRYQSGTRRAVLTLEERFFTDWYPWHLVRIGYAAFFDAGRTWGRDPRGTPSLGMLYDAGFGLRLSSPRASGDSVVHIDLAFPLNGAGSIHGLQLNIETKGSF